MYDPPCEQPGSNPTSQYIFELESKLTAARAEAERYKVEAGAAVADNARFIEAAMNGDECLLCGNNAYEHQINCLLRKGDRNQYDPHPGIALLTQRDALAKRVEELTIERDEAQQWIDSEPEWKAKYIEINAALESELTHLRAEKEKYEKLWDAEVGRYSESLDRIAALEGERKWKDISTAPRDDESIDLLLYNKDANVEIVVGYWPAHWKSDNKHWMWENGPNTQPTHYMLLPVPPQPTSQGEGVEK